MFAVVFVGICWCGAGNLSEIVRSFNLDCFENSKYTNKETFEIEMKTLYFSWFFFFINDFLQTGLVCKILVVSNVDCFNNSEVKKWCESNF